MKKEYTNPVDMFCAGSFYPRLFGAAKAKFY